MRSVVVWRDSYLCLRKINSARAEKRKCNVCIGVSNYNINYKLLICRCLNLSHGQLFCLMDWAVLLLDWALLLDWIRFVGFYGLGVCLIMMLRESSVIEKAVFVI